MTHTLFEEPAEVKSGRPESLAAIRLLQVVVYSNDKKPWDQVLTYRSNLEDYFARVGLALVVDENDGLAYLRQWSDDERDAMDVVLPRLFRRTPLNYDVSLLCVLLRDELRRWEDEDFDNTRCAVTIDSLFEIWKTMQPRSMDEVQCRKSLSATMKKLEQMSFVQKFGGDDEYEIKRILKARLPMEKLTMLRDQMKDYIEKINATAESPSDDAEPAPSEQPEVTQNDE